MGDLQHQGGSDARHPYRNPYDRYIPALDRSVEFEVTYIAVQADFATWSATRTQGGFDIRTFAVKAKPTQDVEYIRPGMSVLVNWKDIAK